VFLEAVLKPAFELSYLIRGPPVKQKDSAYGTLIFPSFRGAIVPRQKARGVPQEGAGRDDVRGLLQKDWAPAINTLPAGAVSAIDHPGPASAGDGPVEMQSG